MTSKIKNSQCGEVRSKKFFQILKKLIKTHPVMYFLSQTDEMSMRTTRITDLFNIQEGSKSPSGGSQVDGLPPAPVSSPNLEDILEDSRWVPWPGYHFGWDECCRHQNLFLVEKIYGLINHNEMISNDFR